MTESAKPTQAKCQIVEHTDVAPRIRTLHLDAPELARKSLPGQFVHVLCSAPHTRDPLLRRPFSIHDVHPSAGRVVLLYEIKGCGTAALASRQPREVLDVVGPLGRGFGIPDSSSARVLLVAGGIGVAALYFLARTLAERHALGSATVLIGARTSELLLCTTGFAALGMDVSVATDDGTAGHRGFVTGLMAEHLKSIKQADLPTVYACGPMQMLGAVADIAQRHELPCQISAEAKMACGVGACMGCVIEVHRGDSSKYVRVCREGPVFNGDEVVWE